MALIFGALLRESLDGQIGPTRAKLTGIMAKKLLFLTFLGLVLTLPPLSVPSASAAQDAEDEEEGDEESIRSLWPSAILTIDAGMFRP